MKIAILTANLNSFDKVVEPIAQDLPNGIEIVYHCFDDSNFPPITGLTPRFQYRIPKLFGWQMFPGYDIYIWLDGSFSFTRDDCASWFLKQLGDADIALFKHPWRSTAAEEANHIEEYLAKEDKYITPRYKNGLHKEQLAQIQADETYTDDHLFTSTAFIYRNSDEVTLALAEWWLHQSRYYTVDQIALPYAVRNLIVSEIPDNQYKIPYLTLVSEHK